MKLFLGHDLSSGKLQKERQGIKTTWAHIASSTACPLKFMQEDIKREGRWPGNPSCDPPAEWFPAAQQRSFRKDSGWIKKKNPFFCPRKSRFPHVQGGIKLWKITDLFQLPCLALSSCDSLPLNFSSPLMLMLHCHMKHHKFQSSRAFLVYEFCNLRYVGYLCLVEDKAHSIYWISLQGCFRNIINQEAFKSHWNFRNQLNSALSISFDRVS